MIMKTKMADYALSIWQQLHDSDEVPEGTLRPRPQRPNGRLNALSTGH